MPHGPDAADLAPLRRLTPAQRAERWRKRMPLLDEDPSEEMLPRRPPGDEGGEPFGGLTVLGRRLTGLDPWPAEGEEEEGGETSSCEAGAAAE